MSEQQQAGFYVETWDYDCQGFAPQKGVEHGPHTPQTLRVALRKLRAMGYDVNRANAHSVLVYREPASPEPRK